MGFTIAIAGKPTLFIHSADLSDNGRVSIPRLAAQTQDATTFADSGMRRKIGLRDVSCRFEGLFDDAAQKSHAALNDLRSNQRIVSIYPWGDAAGKEGLVLNEAQAETYEVPLTVGEIVPVRADIQHSGQEEIVKSLAAKRSTAVTATTNEPGLDNGVSSAGGAVFVVHVFTFSASGGNAQWLARLQHSDDDGAVDPYATIATLTFTAVGADRVSVTGTVKRWLRVRWELDATSGSLLAHGAAKRL